MPFFIPYQKICNTNCHIPTLPTSNDSGKNSKIQWIFSKNGYKFQKETKRNANKQGRMRDSATSKQRVAGSSPVSLMLARLCFSGSRLFRHVEAQKALHARAYASPKETKGKIYGKSADKHTTMNIDEIKIEKVENTICGIERGNEMSFKEADSGNVNPNFAPRSSTDENCQSCVVGFKARIVGFNVKAKPFDENNGLMVALAENTSLAWIDKKTGTFPGYIKPKENHMPRLLDWFDKNLEEKTYYTIEFYWKGSMDGHIMLTFKQNNRVILYDPQSNETFSGEELVQKLYTVRRSSIKLLNISDCDLNKTVVESVLEAKYD